MPKGRNLKKLVILFILLSVCASYAASGFTYFWTPKSKDTVTAVRLKANYDTLRIWGGRIADTLTLAPVRWSGHMLHDSTFSWLQIDSIRHSPNIDTILGTPLYIKGRTVGDTIAATFGSATNGNFTNLTYDSAGGRVIKASGPITSDSCYARSKRAVKERLDSTLTVDSVNARATRGVKAKYDSTLTVDSVNTRALGGTTKTDSINSIKGIKAPSLGVTATVTADSVNARAIGNKPKFDSLTFNSISYLKTYIDTTFPCSLFDNTTFRQAHPATLIQCGRIITFYLPTLIGTVTGGASTFVHGIAAKFLPSTGGAQIPVSIINNSAYQIGLFYAAQDWGGPALQTSAQGVLTAGTGGCLINTVTWIK